MVLPESESFIEEESRRRLFWVVYLLDRYATVATAFEFALDERDIDRRLVSTFIYSFEAKIPQHQMYGFQSFHDGHFVLRTKSASSTDD